MKRKASSYIGEGVLIMVLGLLAATMVLPFLWSLSASFQYDREIFQYPFNWIPQTIRLSNYEEVWTKLPFPTYYYNTFKVTIIVTVGQVIICSLAAYAFAKLEFPGRDKIFLLYLATMMVPWHAIMIPQFIVVKNMGLFDTHASLILLQLFRAFGVFLMRQTMLGIPGSLCEAARIDGCGELRIFARIVMPMCKAGVATLAVFTFNFMWNDYLGPTIYLNNEKLKTLQLGIAMLRSQYGMQYGLIMAGTVSALLPMVLIYIFAQKYLVEGVAFSGLKG